MQAKKIALRGRENEVLGRVQQLLSISVEM